MREEIGFEIVDFRNFDGPVTLTLDDLEYYIVRFVSSTSIHIAIVHMTSLSLIMNGPTEGHSRKCKLWGHVPRERGKNSKI